MAPSMLFLATSLLAALVPKSAFASPVPQDYPANSLGLSSHWVDTWTAMPQLTEFGNVPPPPFNQSGLIFNNSSIRQTLHMSVGGSTIRLRFSNAFSNVSLPITSVTIALPVNGTTGSREIDVSTLKHLTFSGNSSIIIPDGSLAVSDPVNFTVGAQSELAVTMYLANGQASNYITSHPGSRVNSWFSFGDYTTAENMSDPSTQFAAHWYFVSATEVWSPPTTRAFVIVGDSITDGRGSDTNMNDRWPDNVLAKMQQNPTTKNIAVNNQAAGGNQVLTDGLGPNAIGRIDRDVLSQSGVRYCMIFEGVNDIGTTSTDVRSQQIVGDRLIQAYQQIITRVHTFGIPMFGATITPFGAPSAALQGYSDPNREATRLRVNNWIRNSGKFDAVIDFDAMLRDPANATQLNPLYNSGDYLHPNEAGYQVIGNQFPLSIFDRFQGGVSSYQ